MSYVDQDGHDAIAFRRKLRQTVLNIPKALLTRHRPPPLQPKDNESENEEIRYFPAASTLLWDTSACLIPRMGNGGQSGIRRYVGDKAIAIYFVVAVTGALFWVTRYEALLTTTGGGLFLLNRWTGEVRFCQAKECNAPEYLTEEEVFGKRRLTDEEFLGSK